MMRLFERIDDLNSISAESTAVVRWLERAIFVFMTLMTVFAPHSIAATQSAWLIGMVLWAVVSFMRPAQRFPIRGLEIALWAFFGWSVVSSLVSYAPDISFDKLRGVSLFLICLYVAKNLRTLRAARFLGLALVVSTMVSVGWTPIERIIGRGVQIYDFQGSGFESVGLWDGDVILTVDGKKVNSLAEVAARIAEDRTSPKIKTHLSRTDYFIDVEVPRDRINFNAATPEETLGIRRWQKSRNWRAAGFYGHYVTFAEVLQLIASLTLGLFVAGLSKTRLFDKTAPFPLFHTSNFLTLLLGVSVAMMAFALLLTVTRASQLAFLVSGAVIVVANGNRRLMLTLAAIALPAALIGLFVLRDMRKVDFLDAKDNSTTWRQTVYREGFNLWTSSPRNFTVGVGMDSIKRYAGTWHLFDDGRLPMGHFHSTPLQLCVERGLPALLIWLSILGIYGFRIWDFGFGILKGQADLIRPDINKSAIRNQQSAIDRGLLLGTFGGLAGFFTSGLVHYNLGDGEVAMVFYLIMGLAVVIATKVRTAEGANV